MNTMGIIIYKEKRPHYIHVHIYMYVLIKSVSNQQLLEVSSCGEGVLYGGFHLPPSLPPSLPLQSCLNLESAWMPFIFSVYTDSTTGVD